MRKFQWVIGDLNPRTSDLETGTLPPHHQAVINILGILYEKETVGFPIYTFENFAFVFIYPDFIISKGNQLNCRRKESQYMIYINVHVYKITTEMGGEEGVGHVLESAW